MKTGRKCTICFHPRRWEIDHALTAGETIASVARRFEVSKDALQRHRLGHLKAEPIGSDPVATPADDSLAGTIKDLVLRLRRLLDRAERARDTRAAVAVVRACRETLLVAGRLTGALDANGAPTGRAAGTASSTDELRRRVAEKLAALAAGHMPPTGEG